MGSCVAVGGLAGPPVVKRLVSTRGSFPRKALGFQSSSPAWSFQPSRVSHSTGGPTGHQCGPHTFGRSPGWRTGRESSERGERGRATVG